MKKYHYTKATETVTGGIKITVTWKDEQNATICSGNAIVSRDAAEYAPFLAADVRQKNIDLFEADETTTDPLMGGIEL